MKFVFMVILGIAVAIGATLYFQPNFFEKYLNLNLPTPAFIITSPQASQAVDLRFTVSGSTKVDATLRVLNSSQFEIWSQAVAPGRFSADVNLTLRASPGDKITLELSSTPQNLISIPLLLR